MPATACGSGHPSRGWLSIFNRCFLARIVNHWQLSASQRNQDFTTMELQVALVDASVMFLYTRWTSTIYLDMSSIREPRQYSLTISPTICASDSGFFGHFEQLSKVASIDRERTMVWGCHRQYSWYCLLVVIVFWYSSHSEPWSSMFNHDQAFLKSVCNRC